ncbi:hypothetical protein I316_05206 [Kwoniella heveanensis BCC8398]|uniref:Uncharacterized protein n=1 Tax=Kwoniella heveanensis BCC8398 TaxID=1296120 RepID=A0A1B9GQ82_9TREE|nr:hypothetical protein I316_05206 [Kwoniella heveanensis BCC8398]
MPSLPDLVQRSIVLTSVGLTIYGGLLITHGIGSRALRARGYLGGLPEEEKNQTVSPPPTQPS